MEASGLVTGTAIWSTFSQWSSSPNPHAAQGGGPRPGGGSLCHCFLRRYHEDGAHPANPSSCLSLRAAFFEFNQRKEAAAVAPRSIFSKARVSWESSAAPVLGVLDQNFLAHCCSVVTRRPAWRLPAQLLHWSSGLAGCYGLCTRLLLCWALSS